MGVRPQVARTDRESAFPTRHYLSGEVVDYSASFCLRREALGAGCFFGGRGCGIRVLKVFKDIKDFCALRYSRYRSSEIVLSLNNMCYCLAITWDANMLAKSLSNLYFSVGNSLILNMRKPR